MCKPQEEKEEYDDDDKWVKNPLKSVVGAAFENPLYGSSRKSTISSRMKSQNGIEMAKVMAALDGRKKGRGGK